MAIKQEYDVFISYSRHDIEFVDRLAKDLSSGGFEVFIDREAIKGGDLWRQQIVEGIENSKVFLIVLSPDSVASDNVRKELDLAAGSGRRILPVSYRAVRLPDPFRYQLAGYPTIKIENENYSEGFRTLLEAVKQEIAKGQPDQAPGLVIDIQAQKKLSDTIEDFTKGQASSSDVAQSAQSNSASASIPIITSESPILSSLNFMPF